MHPSRRLWPLKLGLLGLGLVAGVLLAEAALRIAGVGFPSMGRMHPVRGWSVRPNVDVLYEVEGRGRVVTNADGLRDVVHTRDKPSGAYRIAVLGDSFTFAANVDVEQTFCARLETRLADCTPPGARALEVVNFGVTGYGTAQQLLLLDELVWQYDPDMVLLAFLTSNDLHDNTRALGGDPLVPYYTLVDGELVLDDAFSKSRPYRVKSVQYEVLYRSRLAQLLKQASKAFASGNLARRTPRQGILDSTDADLYREPRSEAWDDAWAVTEALLRRMHDEAATRGVDFVVATLSNPIQVHPDRELRVDLQRELGIDDPWYPDDRIRRIGTDAGFPVIAMARRFAAEADRSGTFFHGFDNTVWGAGHWNADGHALAAQVLAEGLCPLLAPDDSSASPSE